MGADESSQQGVAESQGDEDGDEGSVKLEENWIDQRRAWAKESGGDCGAEFGL